MHLKHLLIALALVLSVPALAKDKVAPEWQTGKLVSFDKTITHGIYAPGNGTVMETKHREGHVVIASPDLEYFGDFRYHGFSHLPELTENGTVKYRIEKDNLFFQDDTGREYKTHIFKRRKPEEGK